MNIKKKIISSFRVVLSGAQNFTFLVGRQVEKSSFMKVLDTIFHFLPKLKTTRTDRILFSLFFFLFLSLSSFSQNSQLQNFTTKDGLPQSQVYDIVQDSIGYLWLATQGGGLARFDGDKFTVFNERNELKSNFVNSLLVRNDSLFIGTHSGLSIYSKGKFTSYESPKINRIVSINNSIYLATNQGVYQFKNKSVDIVKSVAKIDLSSVTGIIKDGDSYLVGTKKGVWTLDQLENPTTATKIDDADYSSLINVNEHIVASTFNEGIKLIKNGVILKSYVKSESINSIRFIEGDYWLSTNTKGIIKLDHQFKRVQTINQNNGLIVNQIHTIIKDNQENIWIGSSGGGLYKLTQNNFKHFDRNSGLKGNRVYAVHNLGKEVWVSNSEKGILRIGSYGITPIEDNGYLNVKAKTIASDPTGSIWVGTEGKGILVFQTDIVMDTIIDNSKFNSIDKELFFSKTFVADTIDVTNGLTSNSIKKIEFGSGSAWIATYASGIVEMKIHPKTQKLTNETIIYDSKKGIKDLYINDIKPSSDGSLWYATRNGNLGYIKDGRIRDYYQILDKNISISTIVIKGNEIYLGTLGDGIWIANIESPREIKQLSGVKNLNSNNIYQLIFDNENNLWAGTEKGVNKIVLDANTSISNVFYFDRSDGFLGIETCQNAIAKDDDGNIWFGTMNGLTKYIPSNNQLKKIQPTISFESVEVTYQTLDSIDINNYSKVLQLKPAENHLSFQFKSVDINHPDGVEYRWKLNGDFSPWSSKAFTDFPNLDNDDYQFTVQARNIDWIESKTIDFKFSIEKPLIEKPWFLWVVYSSLSLILLLILLLILRRIKLKNKQKISQLAMENHLLSLEQKALQLQMNPHFIFNVLNGIKAMGSEGETQQMNTTINTFASLLRSILNSSRQEEISLKEEVKTLENYLTLEQQMSPNPFEYKIHVKNAKIDIEEILIPPMLIQPFAENSIKHGFQNLNRIGELTISFNVKGAFLDCEIKDNGIGIEKSKQQKQTQHQSMALQVTKERIESLSGINSLRITDNNGTKITFRLPLKTDF